MSAPQDHVQAPAHPGSRHWPQHPAERPIHFHRDSTRLCFYFEGDLFITSSALYVLWKSHKRRNALVSGFKISISNAPDEYIGAYDCSVITISKTPGLKKKLLITSRPHSSRNKRTNCFCSALSMSKVERSEMCLDGRPSWRGSGGVPVLLLGQQQCGAGFIDTELVDLMQSTKPHNTVLGWNCSLLRQLCHPSYCPTQPQTLQHHSAAGGGVWSVEV